MVVLWVLELNFRMKTKLLILSLFLSTALFGQVEQKILKNELSTSVGFGKIYHTFNRPPYSYSPLFLSSNFRHYLNEKLSLNFSLNIETFVDLRKFDDCFYQSANIFLGYDFIHAKKVKISLGIGGNSAFYWLSFNAYQNLLPTERGNFAVGLFSNLNFYYYFKSNMFCKLIADYELNLPYKYYNTSSLRYGMSFGLNF